MSPRKSPDLSRAFGLVLRRARFGVGLSQEELAAKSGLHRTYISQVERGLKSPSLSTLQALANALHRPVHLLVKEAEEETR